MSAPVFSLYEVLSALRSVVEEALPDSIWVRAEVRTISQRGLHCYADLIETSDGAIVAAVQAHIWHRNLWTINRKTASITDGSISNLAGKKVLVLCKVDFTERYGAALNILDIDPVYTLGEAERMRAETIERLKREGAFELNKKMPIPSLVKRVAVVSSGAAAGYADFMNQLERNDYGYRFETTLFDAIMQGEKAPASIVAALDKISQRSEDFDVTVIIRGGGSRNDLAAFDNEMLCRRASQHCLPIISGIGHEIDTSVLDLVASVRVKTPTHAAVWIIDRAHAVDIAIEAAAQSVAKRAKEMIDGVNRNLLVHSKNIQLVTSRVVSTKNADLIAKKSFLNSLIPAKIRSATNDLNAIEKQVRSLDPKNVLNRGFAYVTRNGKSVQTLDEIAENSELSVHTAQGVIDAKVVKIEKNK